METLKEKLRKFMGKEIFIKDTNGTSFGGILKELGEDYCVMGIAKRKVIYTFNHIVTVEERVAPGKSGDDSDRHEEGSQDQPSQMTDE
jgi:hypothetical protein